MSAKLLFLTQKSEVKRKKMMIALTFLTYIRLTNLSDKAFGTLFA